MCTPTLSAGGRVEHPTKFSKRGGGGLTGPQLLEGGCWERGGDFFQGRGRGGGRGGCNFQMKNKLKSEIFNEKKFISKNILA